jgi:16S rRNA (cytidine1402-2'-O)-methyltransferase
VGQEPEVSQQMEKELHKLYQQGAGAKEAVARLSESSGLSRKKLYQAWLKVNKGD